MMNILPKFMTGASRLRMPVVLALLCGLGVSAAASLATFRWEQKQNLHEREQRLESFSHNTEQRLAALQKSLDSALDHVALLAGFIGSHPDLSEAEFQSFTGSIRDRHPSIHALYWIPRVPGAVRKATERAFANRVSTPFRILERQSDGKLVPAGSREDYFPVLFLEPRLGNETLRGVDLGGNPVRMATLDKARSSGGAVASERIRLADGGADGFGVLLFHPLFKSAGASLSTAKSGPAPLIGFVGITLRLMPLLKDFTTPRIAASQVTASQDTLSPSLGRRDFQVAVFDKSAPRGKRLLFGENAPVRRFEELASYPRVALGTVRLGDRSWLCAFFPAAGWFETEAPARFLWVLLAGLLLTLLTVLYLNGLHARRHRIEGEVITVTAALADAMVAVRQNETRFRDVAEAASDWIWETDAQGRFSYFSDRFGEVTGLDPETLLGKTRFEVTSEGKTSQAWKRHRADLEAGRPFRDFIYAYCDGAGRQRSARISGKPVTDHQGALIGYRGVGADITELQHAEKALAESRERIRSVLEAAPLVLMAVNAAGVFTVCQGRGLAVLGWKGEQMVGQTLDHFAQTHPVLVEGFKRAMAGQTLTREFEAGGVFFETRFSPTVAQGERDGERDGENDPSSGVTSGAESGAMAVAIDVTRSRHFEKLRSEFIAAMAHEVRTPLSSIVGYSDMLLEGEVGELTEDQREFVQIISVNAIRLNGLVGDLIAADQMDEGRSARGTKVFDLSRLLQSIIEDQSRVVREKGLELQLELEPELKINGDRERISQVFRQLLSTSLKLTSQGIVRVSARKEGARVCVVLSDSGHGVDTVALESLFRDDYHTDERIVKATGGTGLGLAIARKIVLSHEGSFAVKSAPGQGSEFTVGLPIVESPLPEDPNAEGSC